MSNVLLSTKKSLNNWVKINDEVEFLIDYPNSRQSQKIDEFDHEIQSFLLQREDAEDDILKAKLRLEAEKALMKQIKYRLKCVIKNWRTKINEAWKEVLLDKDGKEFTCKIVNDELDNELADSLFPDKETASFFWYKIKDEIEFTDNDKKKLHG